MPLTAEEKAWADKKIASGVSPQDVVDTIAEARQKRPPLVEYGPGGRTYPAGTGYMPGGYTQAAAVQDVMNEAAQHPGRSAATSAATIASMAIAPAIAKWGLGWAMKYAPWMTKPGIIPAIARAGAGAGTEAAAAYGVTAPLAGTEQAKSNALWQGGMALGANVLTPLAGKAGGVSNERSILAVGNPSVVESPGPMALKNQAESIGTYLRDMPLTKERQALSQMIVSHDAAGNFISADDVIEGMRKAMPSGSSPEAISARGLIERDIENFKQELLGISLGNKPPEAAGLGGNYQTSIGPEYMTNPLTADQLDKSIRESLTPGVKKELQGQIGGKVYGEARLKARNEAAQTLYAALPEGASDLGTSVHETMLAREDLNKPRMFGLTNSGDTTPGAISRVREAGKLQSDVGQIYRDKLARLDEKTGSNLQQQVVDLGAKMEWGPSDYKQAQGIVGILRPGPGTSNVRVTEHLQDFFRMLGRMIARSQGPTGAGIRGALIGGYNVYNKENPTP